MTWLRRLALVAWMYWILLLSATVVALFLIGGAWLVSRLGDGQVSDNSGISWAIRGLGLLGMMAGIIFGARGASRIAPGLSGRYLAIAGIVGLVGGSLAGNMLTEAWGSQLNALLSAHGLPQDANLDDFPLPIAFAIYGVSVAAGTFARAERLG